MGRPGHALIEYWEEIEGSLVAELTDSPGFPGSPTRGGYLDKLEMVSRGGCEYGARVRALVIAPATGRYTFHLAADESAELWLGSDETKWNRKKIAVADVGSGRRDWTAHPGQQSAPVELERGREYYVEILLKESWWDDHFSVGWLRPGSDEIEVVDGAHIRAFATDPEDLDDDDLKDDWEEANGLDARDGTRDQSAWGDFDKDGLTNAEEAANGLDPASHDTDSDGLNDYLELRIFGTDPLLADVSASAVQSVDIGNHLENTLGKWFFSPDGQLHLNHYRGAVEYDLEVDVDGFYYLKLTADVRRAAVEADDFDIRVDGRVVECFVSGENTLTGRLPYLKSGRPHRLRVYWNNTVYSRSLKIRGIELVAVEPAEKQKWLTGFYRARNNVKPVLTSHVSPVCLEGGAEYPSLVRVSVGGEIFRVSATPESGWYGDVSLQREGDTSINVGFEEGADLQEVKVRWQPLDLFAVGLSETIALRKGDSLLLAATDENNRDLLLSMDEEPLEADGTATPVVFDTAGTFTITASRGKQRRQLVVEVRDASFGGPVYVMRGAYREVSFPGFGELPVQADPAITFHDLGQTEGVRSFLIGSHGRHPRPVIVRLPETPSELDNQSVLDATRVATIDLRSGSDTGVDILRELPDGTLLVEMRIVLPDLPPGVTVEVGSFIGGVIFADGSLTKILTAEDFDEFGVAKVQMLKLPGSKGSICHRVTIRHNGKIIGEL